MAKIENPKSYTGRDLETIFFRPMLTGPDATSLGLSLIHIYRQMLHIVINKQRYPLPASWQELDLQQAQMCIRDSL